MVEFAEKELIDIHDAILDRISELSKEISWMGDIRKRQILEKDLKAYLELRDKIEGALNEY